MYGSEPGSYVLTFNVTGLNANNYLEPHNVSFDVKDPQDGKAFEARLGVGFLGLMRCRVNVGRSSLRFKGQDPIDASEHLCDKYLAPPANQTFNCSSLPTEERCRNHLTTKGDVCVWHNAACIFLPQLQGNVSDVAYGSGFTLFLLKTGDVYSIGSTRYGQLGHYSTTLDRVPLNFKVQAIVAGTSHGMALTAEGYVYTWGANYKGQLGQNNRQMQTAVPGMITLPKGENVTCISSGDPPLRGHYPQRPRVHVGSKQLRPARQPSHVPRPAAVPDGDWKGRLRRGRGDSYSMRRVPHDGGHGQRCIHLRQQHHGAAGARGV